MVYNYVMRLDRLLANSGLGTRSQVRDMISIFRRSLRIFPYF